MQISEGKETTEPSNYDENSLSVNFTTKRSMSNIIGLCVSRRFWSKTSQRILFASFETVVFNLLKFSSFSQLLLGSFEKLFDAIQNHSKDLYDGARFEAKRRTREKKNEERRFWLLSCTVHIVYKSRKKFYTFCIRAFIIQTSSIWKYSVRGIGREKESMKREYDLLSTKLWHIFVQLQQFIAWTIVFAWIMDIHLLCIYSREYFKSQ